MIDTHAHIYDVKFDEDRKETIQRALDNGITKILMPNCAEETIPLMLACETNYPDVCISMMGLHPCYVIDNNLHHELKIVEDWLAKRKFCAVGEIGLDYYWDKTFIAEQKLAFRSQIEMALQYKLPIVVHSRDSNADCIQIVKEYIPQGLHGVFHCFSGTLQDAQTVIELGFHLGIGGVVTYKKSGLAEIVQELPLSSLLLETDAPYLAPVPFRGKRNECGFIKNIAQTLSDIHQMPLSKIDEITTQNAIKLFKL
jgi:TatD DNase family protein